MYGAVRLIACMIVVGTLLTLLVVALNSSLLVGMVLVGVVLGVGIYAQEIVYLVTNLALGLPLTRRQRWRP